MLLSPLQEMSNVSFSDIRYKQLECVLQVSFFFFPGCCMLRNVVVESRAYFYVLPQTLYMLPVLPAQGKLILRQVT